MPVGSFRIVLHTTVRRLPFIFASLGRRAFARSRGRREAEARRVFGLQGGVLLQCRWRRVVARSEQQRVRLLRLVPLEDPESTDSEGYNTEDRAYNRSLNCPGLNDSKEEEEEDPLVDSDDDNDVDEEDGGGDEDGDGGAGGGDGAVIGDLGADGGDEADGDGGEGADQGNAPEHGGAGYDGDGEGEGDASDDDSGVEDDDDDDDDGDNGGDDDDDSGNEESSSDDDDDAAWGNVGARVLKRHLVMALGPAPLQ